MDSWGSKNASVSVDGSREDTEHVSPNRNNTDIIRDSIPNRYSSPNREITPNRYSSPIRDVTPNRYSSPPRNMNQIHDDLQLTMHTPTNIGTNVINRSRSSSLRNIDVLKGKFEGNHYQSAPIELPRNPVLDRLTGKNLHASRSDSYYRATNDISYNGISPPNYNQNQNSHRRQEMANSSSPRKNSGMIVQQQQQQNMNGEVVLLEDDYSAPQKPPRRSRSSTPEDSLDSNRVRPSPTTSHMTSPVSPNIMPNDVQPPLSDVTYASQTSLEDAGGFSRDAFGRQSMSEKRHATLDAKSTDTYQRNKKVKDERERQKQKYGHNNDSQNDKMRAQKLAEERNLQAQQRGEVMGLPRVNSADSLVDSLKMSAPVHHTDNHHHGRRSKSKKDIGPSLGMKKSSSLESLQTMVQEIVVQEDMKSGYVPPRSGPQAVKVIRGRGCNESFRQAVDRSYEAPIGGLEHQMETLAEEETESCLSGPALASHGRNVRIEEPETNEKMRTTTGKKKQGLFRGLGSMFRFGRHRKPNTKQGTDWDSQEKSNYGSNIDPIQEQYRRLAEKRRDDRDNRSNPYGITTASNSNDYSDERHRTPSYSAGSGSMRMKKPSRKSMEPIEQDINGNPNVHARSQSYDMYNEMTRPGSRVGFVDPKKYSHYINYDEIKQHLNDPTTGRNITFGNANLTDVQLLQMRNTVVEQRKKAILESRRHQQHYHSQRRENPRERQERPVSNFYEYESVQAAMHSQQQHSQNPNQIRHSQQQQQLPNHQTYGVTTTMAMQMQQQNQRNNNNNGVTLPSPTVPLSMGLRQISPSQFQAVPIFHQNQSSRVILNDGRGPSSTDSFKSLSQQQRRSQSQLQQQNSLPRRLQKVESNYNQQQSSSSLHPQSHHRHTLQPHQFPVSGRYPIGPPSQPQHTMSQQMNQNIMQQQQQHHQQQVPQPQSSSLRINHNSHQSSHQNHQHSNGILAYPPTSLNLSVGSKV